MTYYYVTAGNSKNGFKNENDAKNWYHDVCESGNGYACLFQEVPNYKLIAERLPQ